MSHFFAFSYSFLILIQSFNINLEDLSKIQVLIEHAEYHQETYGDSFIQFLTEHYGNEVSTHPKDHKEHQDLPFKDGHHMLSHTNTAFIRNIAFEYKLDIIEYIQIPFNFFYIDSLSSFEKPSVFQPPKCA
jgi:hypothetical protein